MHPSAFGKYQVVELIGEGLHGFVDVGGLSGHVALARAWLDDDVRALLHDQIDRSLEIVQSPSLSDYINPLARSLVISASQEMINQGFHCEAMFWIFCMRAVCQDTILRDAPDEEQMYYSKKF